MPTEQTFRNAALALDELAAGADDLVRPTAAACTPDVLHGGRFTDDVRRVIDQATADAAEAATACRSAAEECRRRAEAVHAFAQELAAWEAADERYGLDLLRWDARQRAHVDDPLTAPAPGPRPRTPGPRPQPAYGWIG